MTELPSASVRSHSSIICVTLSRLPRCSLMYRLSDMFQPMHGTRKFSIFETHLKWTNSRKSTRMSSSDWWLATITYAASRRIFSRPCTSTRHAGLSQV